MTMTKEEAIQIIKTRFYPSHVGLITNETRENAKALRMAIEALSADVVSREIYEKRIQADEQIIDSYRREFAKATSDEAAQGEWICKGDYAVCSKCGGSSGTQFNGVEPIPLKTNFCPHCGVKMTKGGAE